MPYDNSESKTKRAPAPARSRRTINLVVAGAVAATPLIACDGNAAGTDAAVHMDAAGPDGDAAVAMDTASSDGGAQDAADDDANMDSYPDGVRG